MSDLSFLSAIYFSRIRVVFEAINPLVLPPYKGSAFRGSMGESFRNTVCLFPGMKCELCNDRFICRFSQFYNSYVPETHPHSRKYSKSPHPYIIDPIPGSEVVFKPGDIFGFDLTLIGNVEDRLLMLREVFHRMGEAGMGKTRARFIPIKFFSLNADLHYDVLTYHDKPHKLSLAVLPMQPAENRITLHLDTPLRMIEHGKLLLSPPPFDLLIERIALRLGLLAHFYCGAPWPEEELETIQPTGIQIAEATIRESDWRRYSGTQDKTMNFDGIIGDITYEGEGIKDWMPLLTLGRWLHVGSTATFGLGYYQFENDLFSS